MSLLRFFFPFLFFCALTAADPSITAHPVRASVLPGQTAVFTVSATSAFAPLSYSWEVSSTDGRAWVPVTPLATTATLLTPALSLADDGICYRCVVTAGSATCASRQASIVVRQPLAPRLNTVLAQVRGQVERSLVWMKTTQTSWDTKHPLTTKTNGTWNVTGINDWTAGMWPGIFWLMHESGQAPSSQGSWLDLAKQVSEPIRTRAESPTMGTAYERTWNNLLPFGGWYRASSGAEQLAQLATIVKGADIMVTDWNPSTSPTGQWHPDLKCFGYPRRPDRTVPGDAAGIDERSVTYWHVFADHITNLEQLAFAAQWTNDPAKASNYRSKLVLHAQKLLESQGHPPGNDGSWQRGYFNIGGAAPYNDPNYPANTFAFCQYKQGWRDYSTWARGQGWLMHGVGVSARETQDPTVIALAKRTAQYYLAHLPPTVGYSSDPVLPWDFDYAQTQDPAVVADASAATIAAAGMLALVEALPQSDPDRAKFLRVSIRLLESLTSAAYLVDASDTELSVFRHTVYGGPNDDTGSIWADYYGIEALLTYQRILAANSAPTVVVAAAATPNPVTGITATLSVLGADDFGEAALTYCWKTTGTVPAPVNFADNDSNLAKSCLVTFSQSGLYSFEVTLRDEGNLTATSAVLVMVNQTLNAVVVAPAIVTVPLGGFQGFSASAFDQFGKALQTAPNFFWTKDTGGVGSISSPGIFAAGFEAGAATVRATATVNGVSVSGISQVSVPAYPGRLIQIAVINSQDQSLPNLSISCDGLPTGTVQTDGSTVFLTTSSQEHTLTIQTSVPPAGNG